MCPLSDLASVITQLEALVDGRITTVSHANDIEGDLAELFSTRDDDVIEEFIYDLAFYRPEGGEGLYDFKRFKPMAETALKRLKSIKNGNTYST